MDRCCGERLLALYAPFVLRLITLSGPKSLLWRTGCNKGPHTLHAITSAFCCVVCMRDVGTAPWVRRLHHSHSHALNTRALVTRGSAHEQARLPAVPTTARLGSARLGWSQAPSYFPTRTPTSTSPSCTCRPGAPPSSLPARTPVYCTCPPATLPPARGRAIVISTMLCRRRAAAACFAAALLHRFCSHARSIQC